MAQHSEISDPDIHEPKGITTAAAGTVYKADGSGSGDWELPTVSERLVFCAVINDVSTAGSVYIPIPLACTILGATTVLGGTISGANSSITFFNGAATSLGSAMTVTQSGSAAGDIDTFTATTNTAMTANSYVKVTTDGGSTGTVPLFITILASRTASA
jgi:hypothetical protein